MNLFQKYGIKEVANVTIYNIMRIGDEDFYIPVLFLDTLKVSTLEKTAEKVNASGGYGNKKLIGWNFGKEIRLSLEDALFTPASQSLIWGGHLEAKLSKYTSAMAKLYMANKYGRLHYSTKAYPSPSLTNEEWEVVFEAATRATGITYWAQGYFYGRGDEGIENNRKNLRDQYLLRNRKDNDNERAISQSIIDQILTQLTELNKIGYIETDYHDLEVIDRTESCVVKDKDGFVISTSEQKENLKRLFMGDRTKSIIIYYDPKTMLPLFHLTDDGRIIGLDLNEENIDEDFDGVEDTDNFKLKIGTKYLKRSITVKPKTGDNDGILGKTLVIDADSFPGVYKIVGETHIREQKTSKDQSYQFVINRAQISTDTSITLEAEGEPTTFSMDVDVLTPENDIMIELRQFDVDEDLVHGGTYIVPQKAQYTHTATFPEEGLKTSINFENKEIF